MDHTVDSTKQEERSHFRRSVTPEALAAEPPLHPLLQLQRHAGNQAILGLLQSGAIRAKLEVGSPEDPAESEADEIADRVMRMPGGGLSISRKCEACEQEEARQLRMRPSGPAEISTGGEAPSAVHEVLGSAGEPLEAASRSFFEPRFGQDFTPVRIHADEHAAASARQIGAQAYAVGSHIAFAAGRYDPDSSTGRRLLAHELAHIVQQSAAGQLTPTIQQRAVPSAGRTISRGLIQRDADTSGAVDLDNEYTTSVQMEDWSAAAEWLNGFNYEDIQSRLAKLRPDQIRDLHQGAVDNPRVGPQAQVTLLTEPGTPRASTPQPLVSTAGPPTASTTAPPATAPKQPATEASQAIAQMDKTQKIMEALKSAIRQAPEAFGGQVEAMLQPQALLEFAAFTLLFAGLQATPAGWATDLAIIGLEAYLIGPLVFQAVSDLVEFVSKATGAQDQVTIDQAGHALADALGILGVALLMKLLFHSGKAEAERAPSGGAEIKPKAAEAELPAERPKEPPAGQEVPSETPAEATARDQDLAGGGRIVGEEKSADGLRTIRIREGGVCEVCASPCWDIRSKYVTELVENPDLAAELDQASGLTDLEAQRTRFKEIEQKLASKRVSQPLEPGLLRGAAEARQPVNSLHDFIPEQGSGRRPGHARSGHGWAANDPAVLDIRNNPDRIYVGRNRGGNQVAVFLKGGDVVITDLADTQAVITAYGEHAPIRPSFVRDKWAGDPSYSLVH